MLASLPTLGSLIIFLIGADGTRATKAAHLAMIKRIFSKPSLVNGWL